MWYEGHKPSELGLKSEKIDGSKIDLIPDWEHGYVRDTKDFKTVEVVVHSDGQFGFATKECRDAYEQTRNAGYLRSLTQLIIYTEKKKNRTTGFLMTLIPDKEYREKMNFKVFNSSYKWRQKGYSGYILYHTLKGDYANGWGFREGKVTTMVKPKEGESFKLNLKDAECQDFYYVQWTTSCEERWSEDSDGGNETYYKTICTTTENAWLLYTECMWNSNDTYVLDEWGELSTYGGGGYSSGTGQTYDPSTNSPNTPTLDPLVNKSKLTNDQLQTLENTLHNLKLADCLAGSSFEYLEDQYVEHPEKKIDEVCILSGSSDASFEYVTDTTRRIRLNSEQDIFWYKVDEEFFHAAQDNFYDNGILQYSDSAAVGKSNLEFEAALYLDIIARKHPNGGYPQWAMFPPDPNHAKGYDYPGLVADYVALLDTTIQNGGTNFTSQSYHQWVEDFKTFGPSTLYNTPQSNDFQGTPYLDHLLELCNP